MDRLPVSENYSSSSNDSIAEKTSLVNGMTKLEKNSSSTVKIIECQICGNPATSVTYGFNSCNPCKKFFQRHRFDRITDTRCALGGRLNCDLSKRRPCTKCRLLRCIRFGKNVSVKFLKEAANNNKQIEKHRGVMKRLRSFISVRKTDGSNASPTEDSAVSIGFSNTLAHSEATSLCELSAAAALARATNVLSSSSSPSSSSSSSLVEDDKRIVMNDVEPRLEITDEDSPVPVTKPPKKFFLSAYKKLNTDNRQVDVAQSFSSPSSTTYLPVSSPSSINQSVEPTVTSSSVQFLLPSLATNPTDIVRDFVARSANSLAMSYTRFCGAFAGIIISYNNEERAHVLEKGFHLRPLSSPSLLQVATAFHLYNAVLLYPESTIIRRDQVIEVQKLNSTFAELAFLPTLQLLQDADEVASGTSEKRKFTSKLG